MVPWYLLQIKRTLVNYSQQPSNRTSSGTRNTSRFEDLSDLRVSDLKTVNCTIVWPNVVGQVTARWKVAGSNPDPNGFWMLHPPPAVSWWVSGEGRKLGRNPGYPDTYHM
jgi:hypothetical protein